MKILDPPVVSVSAGCSQLTCLSDRASALSALPEARDQPGLQVALHGVTGRQLSVLLTALMNITVDLTITGEQRQLHRLTAHLMPGRWYRHLDIAI